MGFERDEVPSRVKGSALVGLGKAQNTCMRFSLKTKEYKTLPGRRKTDSARDRRPRIVPSQIYEKQTCVYVYSIAQENGSASHSGIPTLCFLNNIARFLRHPLSLSVAGRKET